MSMFFEIPSTDECSGRTWWYHCTAFGFRSSLFCAAAPQRTLRPQDLAAVQSLPTSASWNTKASSHQKSWIDMQQRPLIFIISSRCRQCKWRTTSNKSISNFINNKTAQQKWFSNYPIFVLPHFSSATVTEKQKRRAGKNGWHKKAAWLKKINKTEKLTFTIPALNQFSSIYKSSLLPLCIKTEF